MIDPLEVQVLNIVCGVRCVFSQHRCMKNIVHSGEGGWQRQPVCHDTNPLRDLKCTYEPGANLPLFAEPYHPSQGLYLQENMFAHRKLEILSSSFSVTLLPALCSKYP